MIRLALARPMIRVIEVASVTIVTVVARIAGVCAIPGVGGAAIEAVFRDMVVATAAAFGNAPPAIRAGKSIGADTLRKAIPVGMRLVRRYAFASNRSGITAVARSVPAAKFVERKHLTEQTKKARAL